MIQALHNKVHKKFTLLLSHMEYLFSQNKLRCDAMMHEFRNGVFPCAIIYSDQVMLDPTFREKKCWVGEVRSMHTATGTVGF
jgi:sulfite exporter TauE/SafE